MDAEIELVQKQRLTEYVLRDVGQDWRDDVLLRVYDQTKLLPVVYNCSCETFKIKKPSPTRKLPGDSIIPKTSLSLCKHIVWDLNQRKSLL
jgi:hypothetical protein